MNLKTKLAATLLMMGSASMAQAVTYDVAASFDDGGIQGITEFNGSLNLDANGDVVSFGGLLSESMWAYITADTAASDTGRYAMGSGFYMNGTKPSVAAGMHEMANGGAVDHTNSYMDDEAPLLNLTYNPLASSTNGNLVTITASLNNNDSVFMGAANAGFSDTGVMTNGSLNAFFTLVYDKTNPLDTTATLTEMMYGDCTGLGLMSGVMCMTGHDANVNGLLGTMNGAPLALSLEVAAVPVPAAAWLFGGALMSLVGANRRKNVLPA